VAYMMMSLFTWMMMAVAVQEKGLLQVTVAE
jgi:hypothetical protein